ncbi:hypothetical protein [Marimonas lutisalis]|uniref:hypothetical protein n=1 Tax=Marimonas lutisalis TaxID=2545756 RepID=UPI0010F9147A|nr:hypothetical protein [Marimonas lutisalis]
MRLISGLMIALMAPFFAVLDLVSKLTGGRKNPLSEPLRLYNRNDKGMAYVWISEEDGNIRLDVGEMGHPAETGLYASEHWPRIRDHLEDLQEKGFAEIPSHEMQFLQIVYDVAGDYADRDELDKRAALTARVEEFLARTGQGYWIDATTGNGTMETGFLVVDFDIASATVSQELAGTEFDDFTDIRKMAPAVSTVQDPEPEVAPDAIEEETVIDDVLPMAESPSEPDNKRALTHDDDALFDKFEHFGDLQPAR